MPHITQPAKRFLRCTESVGMETRHDCLQIQTKHSRNWVGNRCISALRKSLPLRGVGTQRIPMDTLHKTFDGKFTTVRRSNRPILKLTINLLEETTGLHRSTFSARMEGLPVLTIFTDFNFLCQTLITFKAEKTTASAFPNVQMVFISKGVPTSIGA